MHIPKTSENFVALRSGLLEHVETGRLSIKEYALFTFLLLLTEKTTGTLLTNARILAERMRQSVNAVQWALYQLRAKRYVHYEDQRGHRGPYLIFMDKYRIRLAKGHYFYTSIFRDSKFIGEKVFFAQLKVCNLYLKLGSGYRLSFSSHRLSTDFDIDFPTDFDILIQHLDKYTENDIINRWLTDIEIDFPTDFQQTLIKNAEEEIELSISYTKLVNTFTKDNNKRQQAASFKNSNPQKKIQGISQDSKEQLAKLCNQLVGVWEDFDPKVWLIKIAKADIPHQVVIYLFSRMLQLKSKIKNPIGFLIKVLQDEYSNYSYAQNLKKHMENKGIEDVKKVLENSGDKHLSKWI